MPVIAEPGCSCAACVSLRREQLADKLGVVAAQVKLIERFLRKRGIEWKR